MGCDIMRQTLITLLLSTVCVLFSAVSVQAYSEADKVPGFDDLHWGESVKSVSSKYGLRSVDYVYTEYMSNTIPGVMSYDMTMKKSELFGVYVWPTAHLLFINDKLYNIGIQYTQWGNLADYERAKTSLTEYLGTPSKEEVLDNVDIATWNKGNSAVSLIPMTIGIGNPALAQEANDLMEAAENPQTERISDWNAYINGGK